MRALVSLARRQKDAIHAVRTFASGAEVAVAAESPFLRFATPAPQAYNFTQALGDTPETKVCQDNSAGGVLLQLMSVKQFPLSLGFLIVVYIFPTRTSNQFESMPQLQCFWSGHHFAQWAEGCISEHPFC